MTSLIGKAAVGAALAATAVLAAAPAEARDRYWRPHHGDDAAVAVAAGIAGLAIGAALASDNHRGRYYYDRGYYPRYRSSYYYYPRSSSYYYDSYPRGYYYGGRYDGYDRYYERQHRRWHRRHDGWGY